MKTILILIVGLISFYFSGFRNIYNRIPNPEYASIFYLLIGSLIFIFFVQDKVQTIINRIPAKLIFFLLVLYIVIFSFFILKTWEWNNTLKSIGKDSTADDAMILTAKSFFAGEGMYDVKLYDGAPVSPGPGWVLLNSIFSVSGLYFLMTPFWLFAFLYFLYTQFSDKIYSVVFSTIVLSSSFLYWSMSGVGHDLVSISLSIGICYILVRSNTEFKSISLLLFLAIFVGTVSTSRIIFIILPFILSLSIKNIKRSLIFFLVSMITLLLWHSIFYSLSNHYQPLHLMNRGQNNVGMLIIFTGILAESILGLISVFKYFKRQSILLFGLRIDMLLLFLPLLFISYGELQTVDFNFRLWEGANYLIPIWGYFIVIFLEEQNVVVNINYGN